MGEVKRETIEKLVVSVVLVVSFCFGYKVGYSSCGTAAYTTFWGHLVYSFCHVNVWHLLANIVCLWMLRCRLELLCAWLIAVACSFLPCFVGEPTMGFSGMLFAIVGMSWGRVRRFREMLKKNILFLFIPLLIPHVNGLLHVYCMIGGYLFYRYCRR